MGSESAPVVIPQNIGRLDRTLELSGKKPCLHPVFGRPFTPYPVFQRYPQSKDNLINLSMKCYNSVRRSVDTQHLMHKTQD